MGSPELRRRCSARGDATPCGATRRREGEPHRKGLGASRLTGEKKVGHAQGAGQGRSNDAIRGKLDPSRNSTCTGLGGFLRAWQGSGSGMGGWGKTWATWGASAAESTLGVAVEQGRLACCAR
jgi:hypothetical protein